MWLRNARVFSKLWKGVLLPQFLDPLFYLVALGFGLGTYVARINGVPYEDFIAPGPDRLGGDVVGRVRDAPTTSTCG